MYVHTSEPVRPRTVRGEALYEGDAFAYHDAGHSRLLACCDDGQLHSLPMIALTEKEFQSQVVDLAKTLGFRCYHPWLSIRSERGWPDLALFKPGRFLLAELKTDKGKVSDKQTEMLAELKAAGVEVHLWRPRDFDAIVEVLRSDQA